MRRIGVAIACGLLVAACQSTDTGENLPANILGDRAYEAGNYEVAAQHYTAYLAEHPNDFTCLYRRGVAFDKIGDSSAALASLSAALELRPDSRDALLARAHVYYVSGNRQLAMVDLERAMAEAGFADAQPHEQVMAWSLMAQIAVQGGELDRGLKALDEAINLAEEYDGHVSKDHHRKLLYNRAMVGFQLGFYGPACDDYEHYLVLTEDEGHTVSETDYYNACFLNYMAEDFEKARSYLPYLSEAQLEMLGQKTRDPSFFVAAGDIRRANQ